MRNIIKSIALVAVASFALVSCNKEAPSKAEVESGFKTLSGKLPTLSLGSDVNCDPLNGIATLSLTITGFDASLDSLSIGILSSTEEDFSTNKFTALENPAEGVLSATAAVLANKTYYFKAVAASTLGTTYSDVVTAEVPDIPFWAKVPGTYVGTLVSEAYDDKYENSVMTIIANEEDKENSCFVQHLEPYYYSKYGKYGYPNYFFAEAAIDNDKKTISIPAGSLYHYGTIILVGLDSPSASTATAYAPIVLSSVDDETLVMENGFQPLSQDEDGNYAAEDSYAGGVTWKLK